MSVQFGTWRFEGPPVDAQYLEEAQSIIEPYGPDQAGSYMKGNVGVLFRAFQTTRESTREIQPHVTTDGTVVSWDGRLDNREELVAQLHDAVSSQSTDVLIVAAAFERWNIRCLAKLLGDWALSIWDPNDRSLLLAKDPIGTRQLYYSLERDCVTWCTALDPLVLRAHRPFVLDEEYIAGWLSVFPVTQRTPYMGIRSVPPCFFVLVRPMRCSITQYWDFDAHHSVRYRADAEFEEHFRSVFKTSVRRRLRSHVPVLAELSGGMDSSSIVCMADTIIGSGMAETPRLDTISYYNDSEPNWDERPYFLTVEQKRGRTGCHLDTRYSARLAFQFDSNRFAPTPSCRARSSELRTQFATLLSSQGNRVVLSGIGGDEVMGGVPTPTPELADLLATAHVATLMRQLTAWALSKRRPWLHILLDVAREFCSGPLLGSRGNLRPPPWLNPDFAQRNRVALTGYRSRLRLFGPLPSFQENMSALETLRRQIGCMHLPSDPCYEVRYPYLDRDLLAFMYAVPREQVVRPNERRSLMRRALKYLVPEAILSRRRKAFISHGPLLALSAVLPEMTAIRDGLQLNLFGLVDVDQFLLALRDVGRGLAPSPLILTRAIWLEKWLQTVSHYAVIGASNPRLQLANQSDHEVSLRPNARVLS